MGAIPPSLPPIQPLPYWGDRGKLLDAATHLQKSFDKLTQDLQNHVLPQQIADDIFNFDASRAAFSLTIINHPEFKQGQDILTESESALGAVAQYLGGGEDKDSVLTQCHTFQTHLSDLVDTIKNSW